MGAGRRTQTFNVDSLDSHSQDHQEAGGKFRRLKKSDLAGVIFGCTHQTMKECLSNNLFGLPASHYVYVQHITPGMPLFLLNYSDRKIYGIFEAASNGAMNINPYGWTDGGSKKTQYPAQVRVCVTEECEPLAENVFKNAIALNYYFQNHFWFELDQSQTDALMSQFYPRRLRKVNNLPSWNASSSEGWHSSSYDGKLPIDRNGGNSNGAIPAGHACASTTSCEKISRYSNKANGTGDNHSQILHLTNSEEWSSLSNINDPLRYRNEETANPSIITRECSQKELEGKGFTKPKGEPESPQSLLAYRNDEIPGPSSENSGFRESVIEKFGAFLSNGDASKVEALINEWELQKSTILQLQQEILELRTNYAEFRKESLEKFKERDDYVERNEHLEHRQVAMEVELNVLRDQVKGLRGILSNDGFACWPSPLIYILGGYDQENWLASVTAYSPESDLFKHITDMPTARSFGAAVVLDKSIYIMGGGVQTEVYETVDIYNTNTGEWMASSMNHQRGCLGGVSIGNKVYAIGGGYQNHQYSEVEMYDPVLGQWLSYHNMKEKRYMLAATVLGGAMYAVGGFNGAYLNSMERCDPRQPGWTLLESMGTKRASLSVAVLHDKIYAIGGYDGQHFVSSVEVFDPRASSWFEVEHLHNPRGYGAAVVFNDIIYMIGGLDQTSMDTIEYYSEGEGWLQYQAALGKRSLHSAVVVD